MEPLLIVCEFMPLGKHEASEREREREKERKKEREHAQYLLVFMNNEAQQHHCDISSM
jgi:hypothetical protein